MSSDEFKTSIVHSSELPLLQKLARLLLDENVEDLLVALRHENAWSEQQTLDQLRHHGISGLLAARLNANLAPFLQQEKTLLVANEALRARELDAIFAALSDAQVDHYVLIKGGALAYSLYPAPWQRPRTDLDVLVDENQIEAFCRVLLSLGFQRLFAISGALISYQCSYAKTLIGNATLMVDVHWKISNRQCLSNAVSIRALLPSAKTLRQFIAQPKIPSIDMSLIIACIHRLGHHHDSERLTWLYDMHLLANTMREHDWRSFVAKAITVRIAGICLDGIVATQRLFETDIPHFVITELSQAAQRHEASQVLLKADLSNWDVFKSDLNAFATLRQKMRFIFETAFPSADYLKQKMNTRSISKAFLLRAYHGTRRLLGLT